LAGGGSNKTSLTKGLPPVNRRSFVSGSIGLVMYQNCLSAGADETGLYLRPAFLFGLFGRAVFIPWQALTIGSPRKMRASIPLEAGGHFEISAKSFARLSPER